MKKAFLFFLGWLFFGLVSYGQTYRNQAIVGPIPTTGFYKINLPPTITSKLKLDLSDIRLFDKKQKPVPYLLMREEPVQTKKLFREYQIVQKTSAGKAGTTLILRNPARNKINNISLLIKNTNVTKKAKLSGSPDLQNWFGIENNYVLQSLYSTTATTELKLLHFPLSDYEYYKLEIDDSLSAPLNIITAGYYDTFEENGKYTRISNLTIQQTDSAEIQKTYLKVTSPEMVLLDKLEFLFTDSSYFLRPATVGKFRVRKTRRGRGIILFDEATELTLKSNSENSFVLSPAFKAKEFYTIIDNGDNPPLAIKELRIYQLNTYLVASLQKSNTYKLQFTNPEAFAPSYDLAYFKDQIPAQLPEINPTQIKSNKTATTQEANPVTIFTNKNIIWAAIILVIGLLGYMSFKMLNETSKRPD